MTKLKKTQQTYKMTTLAIFNFFKKIHELRKERGEEFDAYEIWHSAPLGVQHPPPPVVPYVCAVFDTCCLLLVMEMCDVLCLGSIFSRPPSLPLIPHQTSVTVNLFKYYFGLAKLYSKLTSPFWLAYVSTFFFCSHLSDGFVFNLCLIRVRKNR